MLVLSPDALCLGRSCRASPLLCFFPLSLARSLLSTYETRLLLSLSARSLVGYLRRLVTPLPNRHFMDIGKLAENSFFQMHICLFSLIYYELLIFVIIGVSAANLGLWFLIGVSEAECMLHCLV